MNQVKESRIGKFIVGLRDIIRELTINDGTREVENKELESILAIQNGNRLEKLENEIETVYISLDDNDKIAPKAKVSEKLARERADKIKSEKIQEEKQSQIGE